MISFLPSACRVLAEKSAFIHYTMSFYCRRLTKVLEGLILAGIGLVLFAAVGHAQSRATATLTIQANQPGAVVSSNLFGIFFEEINFAGEGGIYAEMVQNRSFYDPANPDFWTLVTQGTAAGAMSVDPTHPLNTNIVDSLKLTMQSGAGSIGVGNAGFWGMSLQAGATYILNFYAAASNGFTGAINAQLQNAGGSIVYAQASFSGLTTNWQLFTAALVPSGTDTNARIVLRIGNVGTVWLDVVSLFPQATFLNRTNGMRADLANALSALQPSFLRFPGGNYIEGSAISNAFRWKSTIGNIANRPGHEDPWGYWSTDGLGYHEYLQLCEDLGMTPLFDINSGQALGSNGDTNNTVPLDQMGPWVQDALDAIEYANGGTNTTWGAQRAVNGHPAPFNLQYIEIGNESGGTYYNERYPLFYNAIKSNYPAIHIIAPDWGGIPTTAPVEIEDQHYYSDEGTFISYATMYDSYSRSGPKVFIGEYAVTANYGAYDNLASALGEAAFMTGMERNSDLVVMASYAPLFANVNGMQWQPDMIYYDSARAVFGTPSYYVQQMFSQNRGNAVLPASLTVSTNSTTLVAQGAIGVGSWNTSVQYTNIVVTSNDVTLYKSDFVDDGTNGWNVYNGTWSASGGLYQQSAIITDCYSTTGNTNWANYTISLQARKVGGDEGFLILFNVLDDNDWTWWNIGGWSDTLDGIEQTVGGNKTTYAQVSQFIATNVWYYIRIVVTGSRAQCYLGINSTQAATNLVQDVTLPTTVQSSGLLVSTTYASAVGQVIVKAVNPYNTPVATTVNVTGVSSIQPNATLVQLTSGSSADQNTFLSPTYVFPVTNSISNAGTNFALTFPANSLSILRLYTSGINTYTNLMLQCPSPIQSGQLIASTVLGQLSGNWINLTANTNYALSWSSANTNIAVVDIHGNVVGVGLGTTTITATYASLGLSASQAVQVDYVPTALVHRYSFKNGTANDSVGTANGTLVGHAAISGGQLVLPNTTSAAPATDYLQLPTGILTNAGNGIGANKIDPAVTVEAWATISPNQYTWANLFDFGNQDASGQSEYDIHVCVHSSDDSTIAGISDSDNANVDYQYIDLGSGSSLDGSTNIHITAVFNPPAGYVAIYLNGVLAGADYSVTIPMSGVEDVRNIVGADNWPDPGMQGSIEEFRIYNGALQADEIAATQALGPNQLLSTASPTLGAAVTVDNLTLSWPLASAGFTVQWETNLASSMWTNGLPAPQIVGGQWQVTIPISGPTLYYRLAR
jgi:alpha-L-arabinofuranosidase